ncbi:MAG: CRISPR-associated endonuclease Cas2 [Blautia sp.]|nr:CRISPR-associated endonuclease Cas2 [Blautia sp.]
MVIDEYSFDLNDDENQDRDKVFVLVIYDIISNKKRVKLAKMLEGYGFRIQKSAFEAVITKSKYKKLLAEIAPYGTNEDSIRIYRIIGEGQVTVYGEEKGIELTDMILI